ncbi:hypothetical protein ATANTOWER_012592 [Ataeniobius toweri]|uniref:ORM1-like protein 3 n=4 Tax=Goodeidae TaxID=28758 RepID=A0ABU7AJ44_9TELE|nr:hypothetical protein [Ataeniobius toweri]
MSVASAKICVRESDCNGDGLFVDCAVLSPTGVVEDGVEDYQRHASLRADGFTPSRRVELKGSRTQTDGSARTSPGYITELIDYTKNSDNAELAGGHCLRQFGLQTILATSVHATMNVGTAHSEVNPNTRVMNSRGIWLSYILGIGLLHIILLSIPFVSVPVVWTLTNLIHNLCMYLLLHTVKGTPFETPDQGKARLLTHWEQMDYGVQFTASRKFLTITPIVLYILTSFYTKYDRVHFIVNTVSLLTVLIPKLPQLHGVRIFGINKY